MAGSVVWTQAAIAELCERWEAGETAAAIARRLGTSKNAVVAKSHRLALSRRPSPIRRDPDRPAVAVIPKPVCTLPPLPTMPAARALPPPAPAPAAATTRLPPAPALVETPEPQAPVRAPAIPLLPLTPPAVCTWLHNNRAPWRRCDKPTSPHGSSWCAEHRAVVFVRSRDYVDA